MQSMISTAKKIDTFVKVLFWILVIMGGISVLVFAANTALYLITPNAADTRVSTLELDFLTLHPAIEAAPHMSIGYFIINYAYLAVGVTVLCFWLHTLRNILHPMTKGLPFHQTVSVNLKKLAWINVAMGIVSNLLDLTESLVLLNQYNVKEMFDTDKIAQISVEHHFDLDFLLVSLALLLLSYVFRYGAQLQQEVDETL